MTKDAFGHLSSLRERPIPEQSSAIDRKAGYRKHAIEERNPRFDEPLVEATAQGIRGENFYFSTRNPPHYARIPGSTPQLWLRSEVVERLLHIDRRLSDGGLRLWLFDGWRPTEVQRYFHDVWMPNVLQSGGQHWTAENLLEEVETYWSAPTSDPKSPAPHLTGGATDLTLCWADTGEKLWMGSLFDDPTGISRMDYFETHQSGPVSSSDAEARANRRLLYWVMVEAGFCGNPTEWWHYSFGDQMWARLTGASSAVYGASKPPEEGLAVRYASA